MYQKTNFPILEESKVFFPFSVAIFLAGSQIEETLVVDGRQGTLGSRDINFSCRKRIYLATLPRCWWVGY